MLTRLATQSILAVIGLTLCTRGFGQDAIHRLDAYETQRQGWQAYRDAQQAQLKDAVKDLAKARSDADVEGREKDFKEAQDTVSRDARNAQDLKDAATAHTPGEMALVAYNATGHIQGVVDDLNAADTLFQAKLDLEKNQKKLDDAEKAALKIQENISASNQALTTISNEMFTITQGRPVSPTVISWFRQLEDAVVAAQTKVEFLCSAANPNQRCDFVVWDERPSGAATVQFSLPKDQTRYFMGAYVGAKYCVVVLPNPGAAPLAEPGCWNHPTQYVYNKTVQAGINN